MTDKKASRLSEEWEPSPQLIGWAHGKFPNIDTDLETEKFKNYFIAAPGQKGLKRDWERTWKNWIINSATKYGNVVKFPSKETERDRRDKLVRAAMRASKNPDPFSD